jgi:hypothetical protein
VKERHNRVSSHYQINVKLQDGKATGMTWEKLPPKKSKEDKANSIYSIWTSYTNLSEEELWQVFNTIRKSECRSIGLPKHRTAEASDCRSRFIDPITRSGFGQQ